MLQKYGFAAQGLVEVWIGVGAAGRERRGWGACLTLLGLLPLVDGYQPTLAHEKTEKLVKFNANG